MPKRLKDNTPAFFEIIQAGLWEKEGRLPKPRKLLEIANYFHVSVETLTGEADLNLINVKAIDAFLEFLDDNGFVFEQNDDGTVTIGKDGRYFRYAEADFRKMCSDFHEKADPELAMKEWAEKTFPKKLNPRDYFRVETAQLKVRIYTPMEHHQSIIRTLPEGSDILFFRPIPSSSCKRRTPYRKGTGRL